MERRHDKEKEDGVSCLLWVVGFTKTCRGKTRSMRYGLAMATALTASGMSGDFPSVYINHQQLQPACEDVLQVLGNPLLCEEARAGVYRRAVFGINVRANARVCAINPAVTIQERALRRPGCEGLR